MARKKETVSELWNKIFEHLNILNCIGQDEFYEINADLLRAFKEPRLMTKFDFSNQLPTVFKENRLGILPIDNGKYLIGHFDLYQKFPNHAIENIKDMTIPSHITTIDPDNISSEANALHAAYVSGILKDFVGEEIIQTISGRMRPFGFGFNVSNSKIDSQKYSVSIDRPQIEIDGGYEGKTAIVLIEAKNRKSEDFIIRQLYYPFRYWLAKTDKEIKTMYLVYDNGVYNLYEYQFMDIMHYNSLILKNSARYSIKYPGLIPFLKKLLQEVKSTVDDNEWDIPFLQANSMNTIIELIEQLNFEESYTASDIAEILGYDTRQGGYYIAACRYLELMEKSSAKRYTLSKLGATMNSFSKPSEINKLMLGQLVKHPIFHEAIQNYIMSEKVNDIEYYTWLVRKHIFNISGSTIPRRASTLQSWMRWIAGSNV